MDAEIPWMGSGIKSADRVVRGTADTAFIKGKSRGGHIQTRTTLTNTLFRRPDVGRVHEKSSQPMPLFLMQKSK